MAARKKAEDKDVEVQADEEQVAQPDEQDVEDRADGPISLQVDDEGSEEDFVVTEDATGRPVAESYSGRKYSTLSEEVGDPTIVQPKPGGPTPEAGVALGHNS